MKPAPIYEFGFTIGYPQQWKLATRSSWVRLLQRVSGR